MGFDAARFEAARLEPRRKTIPVPGLAEWFAPDTEPQWTIRGVSAAELHYAIEAGRRRATVTNIIKAISEREVDVKTMRSALGMPSDEVPGEVVMRQELLKTASVEPAIDLAVAVKMSELFPIEFHQLTDEIKLLTGHGGIDPGKQEAASQQTTASSAA